MKEKMDYCVKCSRGVPGVFITNFFFTSNLQDESRVHSLTLFTRCDTRKFFQTAVRLKKKLKRKQF